MNKKIPLFFTAMILLACNFLFPQKSAATPEGMIPAQSGFTIVRMHPKDGKLSVLLVNEAQQAMALGQMPVVESDATWCPPCQAIDRAIKAKNVLMFKAYAGTYIIKLAT